MKRFIISALVLLITFCAFLPSVLAEENGYIYTIDSVSAGLTASGQKLTVTVTNLSNQQTDDLIIAAAYSSENELLDLYSTPLSLYALGTGTYSLPIKADTNHISHMKVFIWDSLETLNPLASEYTVTPVKPLDFAVLLSVQDGQIKLLLDSGSTKAFPASETTLSSAQSILDAGTNAKDRIVTYSTDSVTGEIVSITQASENSAVSTNSITASAYKRRTGRLGSYDIHDETIVLDATRAEKGLDKARYYTMTDRTALVDQEVYTGYVFKQDEYTSLVMITKIGVDFDESSCFTVIQDDAVPHYTADDEECELVVVLSEGRNNYELLFKTGVYEESGLGIGDAIFYTHDSNGFVDAVYKVYDHSEGTVTKLSDIMDSPLLLESDWSYNLWDEGDLIQFTTGAVIEVSSSHITFASLEQVKTGSLDTNLNLSNTREDGIVSYEIANDAVAYVYEINSDEYGESRKLKAKDITRIKASTLTEYETETGVYENIDMATVNEALVMIVDGEITGIYVIEK